MAKVMVMLVLIPGYSAHTVKHYNHTQIHRGVCVTKTCETFIKRYNINKTEDLQVVLNECLNYTMWKNYGIQAKLENIQYCQEKEDRNTLKLDVSDLVVAVVYFIILLLNIIGSFYDIYFCNKSKGGNPYLLAFSIKRNWNRMIAPSSGGGSDPRLERLSLFHGMRTMTMLCVIFSHTVLLMSFSFVENPVFVERSYEDPLKQILFNGSLVTHTFFVMSAFLLAYNFMIHREKHQVTFWQWPKGILLRWFRLTPTYALVLATICTWCRHLGSGPLWPLVVESESNACRQYWWAHILFINNYIYDDAFCAPQTWYLAADLQLFCIGLLVCVLAKTPRAQKVTLSLLFITSLVIPAAHTYFQDLEAVVIQSPESYRNLYAKDNTFRLLYARGHTNLSTYTLGLAGGLLAYYWQKDGKELNKKLRFLFWLIFPAGVAVILSGGLFYFDGGRPPTIFRVLYAACYKPVFQIIICGFIIGCIFKIDNAYRSIVEWKGFTWTGRVTYCAFLLHTIFIRGLMGTFLEPVYITDYFVMTIMSSTIFLSYLSAPVLWVCVEAPATAITKAILKHKKASDETTTKYFFLSVPGATRIALTIQPGNVARIMSTFGPGTTHEHYFLLNALVTTFMPQPTTVEAYQDGKHLEEAEVEDEASSHMSAETLTLAIRSDLDCMYAMSIY